MKNWSLWLWGIIFVVMIILSIVTGTIFDKSDWIFLVLIIGFVVIDRKLNKILKLLENKNLKKK